MGNLLAQQLTDRWAMYNGDAMEVLGRLVKHWCPPWMIWLKVATTVFWILLHAFRAHGRAVVKKGRRKKG